MKEDCRLEGVFGCYWAHPRTLLISPERFFAALIIVLRKVDRSGSIAIATILSNIVSGVRTFLVRGFMVMASNLQVE